MAERAFRFSMGIHSAKSRTTLQDKAKRYEDLGFDALHLPDHLGAPAPFPVLTAIASATSTVRLGTYVLNAGSRVAMPGILPVVAPESIASSIVG